MEAENLEAALSVLDEYITQNDDVPLNINEYHDVAELCNEVKTTGSFLLPHFFHHSQIFAISFCNKKRMKKRHMWYIIYNFHKIGRNFIGGMDSSLWPYICLLYGHSWYYM